MKIFPGIIVRQHRTDRKRMGLLREQYAELRKGHLQYCCNQVWMKTGGRIPLNVSAICDTFKISCLMGRHHVKGGSEYHLTDQVSPLVQWSNIILFMLKTVETPSIWSNSLARYIPRLCIVCGENLERRHYSRRQLKNWRRWTHLNSTPEASMQRKC